MRIDGLPRRTPVRIALGLFTVFTLGALLSNLIALRVIGQELDGRREARLLEELAQMRGVYAAGGLDDLSDAVDAIARAADAETRIAVLATSAGGRVAGTQLMASQWGARPDGLSIEDADGIVEDAEHGMLLVTDTLSGGHRLTICARRSGGCASRSRRRRTSTAPGWTCTVPSCGSRTVNRGCAPSSPSRA